jgi:uncharacterized protein
MLGSQRTIIILAVVAFGLGGCVEGFVYYPMADMRLTPAAAKLAYVDITLTTQDGVAVNAWWVPAKNPRATVLFCHGNGGNISYYLDSLVIFNRLGLGALIFDYRGYGKSTGRPSEKGTYLDAEAAWQYLINQRKIAPRQIIIWGRSLGGAIAAHTAARHGPGLVVIESSFTSVPDLAHERMRWLPALVLAKYVYPTRHYLEQIATPTLIIHSPDDEIIPFTHGRKLYESVKGPKAFLQIKGSHNQGFIDSLAVYEAGIDAFIKQYAGPKEVPSP